jgi:hypothetical protein
MKKKLAQTMQEKNGLKEEKITFNFRNLKFNPTYTTLSVRLN